MPHDYWLPSFNFNVEEWDAEGSTYETPAICRTLALTHVVFAVCGRGEARRPVDDQEQGARGEAAPGGDW